MPGISLRQHAPEAFQAMARDEWAHLRGGAFVVKDEVTEVHPVATDRDRERQLWEATAELLERAGESR